jgi:hypothetical protein
MRRLTHEGVLPKRCDLGINGSPFHQYLFNVTPLLKEKYLLDLVGIIWEWNELNTPDKSVTVERTPIRMECPD